ncbi:S8 family serine peptidase [Parasediminibacterium sp. JCM 36343]|uniref:S8 family serine peptidase n=1 Tax=Parasediminibacterium sp. JCM 36343 TaxID=3374279 RepID=UPI00397CC502
MKRLELLYDRFTKKLKAIVVCFFFAAHTFAQPIIPSIHKGDRPKIDIETVPLSAYIPGKLYVKLLPSYRYQAQHLIKDATGNVKFSVPAVDALDQKLRPTEVTMLFSNILANTDMQQQHEAYGFHLWLEITLPIATNIKQALKAYQQTNAFEVVEPVYRAAVINNAPPPFVPNDPLLSFQWNLKNTGQIGGTPGKDISMEDAWGIETGNPAVIVSVHDNAINLSHPDIAQNIAVGKSFNFTNNSSTLTLNSSHGTHCAGIIGMVNNNGIMLSGIAGGNGSPSSGIRLMSCEIFGPNNLNAGFAESLVYAADNGSAISSNSWGYEDPDVYDIAVLDAIDYFSDYGGGSVLNGGLVVFAAGNNGKSIRIYPGAYDRVVCVAATSNQDLKASYSNFGNWIDIQAPGGEGFSGAGIFSTENVAYGNGSGTSYSCPHVVGVAALVASILKGKASANDVREIVLSTTDNNYPLNPNYIGLLGTGRLNAYAAVKKATALVNDSTSAITNLKATYNCNQFNLSWASKNNKPVIIAFNTSSNMGALVNGNSYKIGDTLNGGGIIVYSGTAGNFIFPVIDSISQYSFKAWNVVGSNQYSFSKTIEVFAKPIITDAGASAIQQNFDYPPLFPNKTWHNTNTNLDFSSWIHTANDTSHTGAGDDYSMCLYNYKYNMHLGAADTLSGPQLKVKGADSILLSFWRAYQFTPKGQPYSDTLEVVVSTDCGQTFSSVWKKGGKDLATVGDTTNKEFYPFGGIGKWKQETINLSAYNAFDKILVGFRGYNGEGNNLFLDNINMTLRYKIDIAANSITQINTSSCSNIVKPQIAIKNLGNTLIKSCDIGMQIDGGTISTTHFTGNLQKDDSATVTLSTQTLKPGLHSIKVFTSLPNQTADDNILNDTLASSFTILPTVTLPIHESFEGTSFPPAGWEITQQPTDNFIWRQTDTAASAGSYAAFVENFANPNPSVDDLLTPPLSINNPVDSTFLIFDVAATVAAANNTPDTLQIDITKDCGSTWAPIYKRWGNTLQTAPASDTGFVPMKSQWRTDSINVSSLVNGGDQIRVRFRDINNNSNNIYIDNIRIYSKTLYNLVREKGLLIYPNPVSNRLTIQHYLTPTTLQSVAIYTASGQRVKQVSYNGHASTLEQLSLASLPAGVYAISLVYTDRKVMEKVVRVGK